MYTVGKGTVSGDPNAVWAAYYAAQAQPAAAYPAYQAAVQPTLQSVTGQQAAAAAAGPYAATLSRAAVTPQPSTYQGPSLQNFVKWTFVILSSLSYVSW